MLLNINDKLSVAVAQRSTVVLPFPGDRLRALTNT